MQTAHTGVHPRALLSLLWVFFMLNIVFRDIHQFLVPGYLEQVISGEVFGNKLTDELLLYSGFAVEALPLMVVMPLLLPRAAVRIVNPIGVVFAATLVGLAPPIAPDDVFFLVTGGITLLGIARVGWTRFRSDDSRPSTASALLSVIVVGLLVCCASSSLAPAGIRARGDMV